MHTLFPSVLLLSVVDLVVVVEFYCLLLLVLFVGFCGGGFE
jgi:hypothetical protein